MELPGQTIARPVVFPYEDVVLSRSVPLTTGPIDDIPKLDFAKYKKAFSSRRTSTTQPAVAVDIPDVPMLPDEKPRSTVDHTSAVFGIARDEKVSIAQAEQMLKQRDAQSRKTQWGERINTFLGEIDKETQRLGGTPENPSLYAARQIEQLQRWPGLSPYERKEAENQIRQRFQYPDQGPPSFWQEMVDRAATGLSNVGSGLASSLATIQEKPLPYGPKYTTPEQDKAMADKNREWAQTLWEVAKVPDLAPKRDDILSKVIGMGVETIPYITATTASSLVGGPMGGFAVGYMVEGNSAYRTAIDAGVPEDKARKIGFAVGVFNGAVETTGIFGADRLMSLATKKIQNKILRGAVDLGVGSMTEALEEASQELSAITGEKTYRNVNWDEAVRRTLAAAGGGALVGGMFKTASAAVRGVTKEVEPGRRTPYEGETKPVEEVQKQPEPNVIPYQDDERDRLIKQHMRLYLAWETDRGDNRQKLGQQIQSVIQQIDAIDGVAPGDIDARPFVPTEVRAARQEINNLKALWAQSHAKPQESIGMDYDIYQPEIVPQEGVEETPASYEPSVTEQNVFYPGRPDIVRKPGPKQTNESEEVIYDSLVARLEKDPTDTATLQNLRDLVYRTEQPTYDELVNRAMAGDMDAAQAIQEGRYRVESGGSPEVLMQRAESGDDVAYDQLVSMAGTEVQGGEKTAETAGPASGAGQTAGGGQVGVVPSAVATTPATEPAPTTKKVTEQSVIQKGSTNAVQGQEEGQGAVGELPPPAGIEIGQPSQMTEQEGGAVAAGTAGPAQPERADPANMNDSDMLREMRANYVLADRKGTSDDVMADLQARNEELREELLARDHSAKDVKAIEHGKKAAPMYAATLKQEMDQIEQTYGDVKEVGFKDKDDMLARYEKEGNHKKGESLSEFVRRIACIGGKGGA